MFFTVYLPFLSASHLSCAPGLRLLLAFGVLVYEGLHKLVLRVLLQCQDALLKLGDALARGLFKLLKALLRVRELALQDGGVVGRDERRVGLGSLNGGVLKNDPVPRVVIDDVGLLVGVCHPLLKPGGHVVVAPVVKMNICRIVSLTVLVRLSDKVHMVDRAEIERREDLGDARLRNVRKHIGHKEAELLIDGSHGSIPKGPESIHWSNSKKRISIFFSLS